MKLETQLSDDEKQTYTVRFHFAETEDAEPEGRVFNVKVQGKTIIPRLDVVAEAGGRRPAGQAIEGFALEDCDRIHTSNTVDRVVTWRRGQSNVKPLHGRPIRLRFQIAVRGETSLVPVPLSQGS
ncbi:MAG: malectin domain-containing carbohydrate-binding protein [Planctomycetota bacterium]